MKAKKIFSPRTFQKILLFSSLLALLGHSAPNVKSRASNFFPRGSGAIMNMGNDEFEQVMANPDHMMFLYVFDSEQEKSKQMNSQIVSPVLDEMKGYFKFLAFNCQEEEVKKSQRFKEMCSKDDHLPYFQIIKPPEVKTNPYTGKPMLPTPVSYNENQVTVPKFKTYILSNLPDFSVKLDTL